MLSLPQNWGYIRVEFSLKSNDIFMFSSLKSQKNMFKDTTRDRCSGCCFFAYLTVSYRQSTVSGEVLQFIPISASREELETGNGCTETGVKMKNHSGVAVADHSAGK